jgi:hypothetical protein
MDGFKGKFTGKPGKPHISWENRWFPLDFPLNHSVERWQCIDFSNGLHYPLFNTSSTAQGGGGISKTGNL